MTDNLRGALLMSLGMALFTTNDAFTKALAGQMPLFQVILLRGVLAALVLVPLAWRAGALRLDFGRGDILLIGLRTVGEAGAAFLFIAALFHLPLANATAILQALPLTVTLAGAMFLAEPIGWRRLAAILVGFLGMLLIVRPGLGGFDAHSLYALAAVGCVTLRDIVTRRLSPAVPSLTIATFSGLGVTLLAAIAALPAEWAPVTPRSAGLLFGSASFLVGGYICSVMVMRIADVSVTAPFRYTGLLWALVLGLVIFGDWPDLTMLAGAAIVVGSGLFTLYRERKGPGREPAPLRIR